MARTSTYLLLADDDKDDCDLFKDALEELGQAICLQMVYDGEQLMNFLADNVHALPLLLFLDLNMPRKNGAECLEEIRRNSKLNALEVIIFSTSFDPGIVELLRKEGARHYIRKPNEFSKLKTVIAHALDSVSAGHNLADIGNFVLTP